MQFSQIWFYPVGGTWFSVPTSHFLVFLSSASCSSPPWRDNINLEFSGHSSGSYNAVQSEKTNGASECYAGIFLKLFYFLFYRFGDTQGHLEHMLYQIPSHARSRTRSVTYSHHHKTHIKHTTRLLFKRGPQTFLDWVMDLWFYSTRICWWRVLFLMSIFQDYLSSMLDCPPTCSCSQTEIYCNKSDNGKFFPLLALQDTGSNGSSVDIAELFKNITSM